MENDSNFYKKDANDSQLDNSNSNVVATTSNQNCLSQQQNDNNFHPKNDFNNQNFYQNYSNDCNENYPNFDQFIILHKNKKIEWDIKLIT